MTFVNCLNNLQNQNIHEEELINKLLNNYNNKLRPGSSTGTLQVQLAVNLIQIIDIIEKDQIMIINAFIDHKWYLNYSFTV